ncbi:unnamed protein product [Pleuronectes platessa]|uniref:Uncharacterized protein n=1 Tax=Pleuronectes platessa TaxID=8262 RepID=A0A9N7YM75_PLEPL|nr:unnamed protein product [Pleuronectes platessa]
MSTAPPAGGDAASHCGDTVLQWCLWALWLPGVLLAKISLTCSGGCFRGRDDSGEPGNPIPSRRSAGASELAAAASSFCFGRWSFARSRRPTDTTPSGGPHARVSHAAVPEKKELPPLHCLRRSCPEPELVIEHARHSCHTRPARGF